MASYVKRGDKWRAFIRRPALGISLSESFKSKADAVAWATAEEHKINTGKRTATSERTVEDALREYENRVSPKKRSGTWEPIRLAAFSRDFPEIANLKLSEVTSAHMGRWRDERLAGNKEKGLKPVASSTVLRDINLLSHVFSTARDEWKWMAESPFKGMRRPKEPMPRTRRITDGEIALIIERLGFIEGLPLNTKSARVGAMFVFAVETAMRAGEIADMRWERIDEKRRFVHLPQTKTEVPRDVPLSARALEIIELLKPHKKEFDGFVFGVSSDIRDALFRKAKNAVMLNDIHFHDARREALTRLAKKFNVMELAKISGHTDLRTLQSVYYAPSVDDLAEKLHAST